MMDQNKDRPVVDKKTETRAPSTADIAGTSSRDTSAGQPSPAHRVPGDTGQEKMAPLLPSDQTEVFRTRWTDIQASFVDEPRQAVEQADTLVAEVMKRLAETFANERSNLEGQWSSGKDVSTEDLRVALRRYRSFFDRLLSL